MKTLKDIDPALYARWMTAARHLGWTKFFSREPEREPEREPLPLNWVNNRCEWSEGALTISVTREEEQDVDLSWLGKFTDKASDRTVPRWPKPPQREYQLIELVRTYAERVEEYRRANFGRTEADCFVRKDIKEDIELLEDYGSGQRVMWFVKCTITDGESNVKCTDSIGQVDDADEYLATCVVPDLLANAKAELARIHKSMDDAARKKEELQEKVYKIFDDALPHDFATDKVSEDLDKLLEEYDAVPNTLVLAPRGFVKGIRKLQAAGSVTGRLSSNR